MNTEIVYAVVCGKGNNDPDRKGRIQCMPFDLLGATDYNQGPWAFTEGSGSGYGHTKHAGILVGHIIKCRRYDDGTLEMISVVPKDRGKHAPPGTVGVKVEKKSAYPSVAAGV